MSRTVTIVKPGLATSIQDQGRQGYYHLGIPPSGAMDQYSFMAANLLVGNPINSAVLECTLMAPELKFNCDCLVAVTGAQLLIKLDGQEVAGHTSITVKAGSVLSFGFMTLGARIYIAINGGIDVPMVLGSRSFYSLGGLGGLDGKKLMAEDELSLGEPLLKESNASLPVNLRQDLTKSKALRVVSGLYNHRLTETGHQNFYQNTWKVASEADRIGYRCKGTEPLLFQERTPPFGAGSNPSNIVDAPYPIGSIQVPGGLEPIILHRDAVSGGGYAMVATVISADMDYIGQLQPNYQMQFIEVSMEEALEARREYQQKVNALKSYFQ